MQLDRENNHKRQVNDSDKSGTAETRPVRRSVRQLASLSNRPHPPQRSPPPRRQAEDTVFRTRGDSDDREFSVFVFNSSISVASDVRSPDVSLAIRRCAPSTSPRRRFDLDVDARRQRQLVQRVDRFPSWLNDVDQPFVGSNSRTALSTSCRCADCGAQYSARSELAMESVRERPHLSSSPYRRSLTPTDRERNGRTLPSEFGSVPDSHPPLKVPPTKGLRSLRPPSGDAGNSQW